MKNIQVRCAKPEDLDKLLAFEQSIIEYERPMVRDMMTDKFHYYDLKEMLASENCEVVVAVDDNQVIASGHARIKQSRSYLTHDFHSFLGFMYVERDFRGKGINKLIIEHLIEWSKGKGATCCALTVFDQNQSAIKAYEKMGFKKDIIEMNLVIDK
jgi:GNAT superfamily N-acetyltransferase